MSFSRRHYRAVSPPSDTPEQVRLRIIDKVARETARQERDALFPVITPENFNEACAWFEQRVKELLTSTAI